MAERTAQQAQCRRTAATIAQQARQKAVTVKGGPVLPQRDFRTAAAVDVGQCRRIHELRCKTFVIGRRQ